MTLPPKNAMPFAKHFSTLFFLFLGLSLHSHAFAADENNGSKNNGNREADKTCEVILRGHQVEFLELESFVPDPADTNLRRDTQTHTFSSPEKVIKLPPGRYEVKSLTVSPGLSHRLSYPPETFELTPGKPYELVIEDISCKITAERIGPFLNFDFKGPVDSKGRKYLGKQYEGEKGPSPGYQVFLQNAPNEAIASGTLEYG